MEQQLRDRNLEALDKRFPGMRERIEERGEDLLEEEGCDVIEEEALSGERILKTVKEGRTLYLAGRRDPCASAVNQVRMFRRIVTNAPIFLVGLGNVHYLQEILDATDESNVLFLYEPVYSIFNKQLERLDFEGLFGKRTVVLAVGGINDEDLESVIRSMLGQDRIPLMRHAILPNYEVLAPEKIYDFYKALKEVPEEFVFNLNTRRNFIKVEADNFYHNVEYLRTGYKADQLSGLFPRDIPAFVVSAGPSLNKNIDELRRAKGRSFIIAADTAIKPLLSHGIVPDMFATLDGNKDVKLVTAEGAQDIPLLTMLTSAKSIMDYHKGKKFFFHEGYAYVGKMLTMCGKKMATLPVGGSVATLTFSLACHLGFSHVIFVGQDLAYTGNKAYADGTFQDKIEESDTSKYLMVPGNYEEEVPTLKNLDNYRQWFGDFITNWKKKYDMEFINATEGGAKIEGTELMTLREAVDRWCTKEVDVAAKIDALEPLFNEEEQGRILEYFHDTPKEIHKILDLAKKGERLYQRLENLCSHGNMDPKAYRKILVGIKRNRKQIEQNANYQLMSYTMARAEQIIQSSQFFHYKTMEEEGLELARQGKLFMELLQECAFIFEELAEETVGIVGRETC